MLASQGLECAGVFEDRIRLSPENIQVSGKLGGHRERARMSLPAGNPQAIAESSQCLSGSP